MQFVLFGIAALFGIVGIVCQIIVLIHAFKASVGEGFLCLCVPCYILYYMFSKFEHDKKGLIIAGALGGNIIANVLVQAAGAMTPEPTYDYGGYNY